MGQSNPSHQSPPDPIQLDLRADLHGRVVDFISDQDRGYFDRHPRENVYWRPVFPHELCRPDKVPGCVPMFDLDVLPPGEVWVEVRQLAPGVRTRAPYLVIDPREAA